MKKSFDVVIIGAGAAGLSCAASLAKQNIDCLILEARSRIGGRVLSVDNESLQHVELGAEFVHGAPPLTLELVDRSGLTIIDTSDHHLFLNSNKNLDPDRIRFHCQVRKVKWRKGAVEISYSSPLTNTVTKVHARKLVTTIPIGCLESSDIEWQPRPQILDLLNSSVRMGHVQRLVFHFRERFWEDLQKDKPISFLHAGPEFDFPTWWTQSPLRNGVLIAWQGGPRAQEMMTWSLKKKVAHALMTLSQLSGRSVQALESLMIHCQSHDWSRDPFSKGAYSYLQVGGAARATQLQKPIQQTLYFAGEGFCFDSSRGTVHGALKSGVATAKRIKANRPSLTQSAS